MSSELLELPAQVESEGAPPAPLPSPARPLADQGSGEYPDRLLIARLRRNDSAAFELLVKTHQDRVFDFCVRMLGDREEAFDLTQEIFLSVHQHLDQFRQDARLSTWIFRISRNHCLNRLKYLKRRGRGRSDEYGESNELMITESVGAAVTPDQHLEQQQQRSVVHQAIALLDEEQRTLVVLRDVEGLSYEEIVEITELPEGTVKSRLHRAREKLVGILEKLQVAGRSKNRGE